MADLTNQLQSAAGAAGGGVGGSYLLVAGNSSTLLLLDHTTPGTLTYATSYTTAGTNAIGCRFSPDGNYAVTGNGSNGVFTLLNRPTPSTLSLATTYTLASSLSSGGQLSISWTPDNDYICVLTGSNITVLNHTTPGSLSLASTYAAFTDSVDFNYDASYLIASGGGAPNYTMTLFSFSAGTLTFSATYVASFATYGGAFTPDGNYIGMWRRFTSFELFDHTTPGSLSLATTYTLTNTQNIISLATAWTPDGDYVGFGSSTAEIEITLLSRSGSTLSFATTYANGGSSAFYGLKFSPDGAYLAASGPFATMTLLNHSSGSLSLATTYALRGFCFDWSPD